MTYRLASQLPRHLWSPEKCQLSRHSPTWRDLFWVKPEVHYGRQMVDNFKCPQCGSGRTKPLSVATSTGTRRRKTVGISRRSIWGSSSTYKSDFVSSLPSRPSNGVAYTLIFLGICGIAFAAWISSVDRTAGGFALVIGIVSFFVLMGGIGVRKSSDQLASAQANWDRRWVCARCGNQWQQ